MATLLGNACIREILNSLLDLIKNKKTLTILTLKHIKVLLIDQIFISTMVFRGSNRPTQSGGRLTPPRRPFISVNGHLVGHYPTYSPIIFTEMIIPNTELPNVW